MTAFSVIKKNCEFQTVFEKGHSIFGRYLVVYFLPNEFSENRYGFCVGRSIGNAVTRNHFKRLLRESVRVFNLSGQSSKDILLVARNPIKKAGLNDIIKDFEHILIKAKILTQPK